jgi:hypothetical protein
MVCGLFDELHSGLVIGLGGCGLDGLHGCLPRTVDASALRFCAATIVLRINLLLQFFQALQQRSVACLLP